MIIVLMILGVIAAVFYGIALCLSLWQAEKIRREIVNDIEAYNKFFEEYAARKRKKKHRLK